MAAKEPVRVLVTGAAGQIGCALVPKVARGVMLGDDQPVILHLLDIAPAAEVLNCVKMVLVGAAFPLLKGVVATTDVVEACTGVNIAVMVGGFPRKEGMERKDVMSKNVSIYKSQASALEKHAAANCKVLVVDNHASTIALILKEFAPSIPEKNITFLTRVEHNKTLDLISKRLEVRVGDVKNPIIWGDHSSTLYPDLNNATVILSGDTKLVSEFIDNTRFQELDTTVRQVVAGMITSRESSSALDVASSACDHTHDWVVGTPEETWVSMGVYSDGSYGVPAGCFCSFPVTCRNGEWSIVKGLHNPNLGISQLEANFEEMLGAIRRSKFDNEFPQNQNGAGTSGAEQERNRPATMFGAEVLSIPPIARLTKAPRRLSSESFLRTSNPRSVLTKEDLLEIRGRYGFPNEVELRLPLPNELADSVSEGWICMYSIYFECGLRLPLPPLLIQTMHHYQLAIPQLMPNGMRVFLGLIVLADESKVKLSVDDFLAMYYPQENVKDHGRFSMYPRRKKQVVGEMKNADRYWQNHYFFMHVNERSMGGLANAFYPLWGTLRKKLKKPPSKALIFEEKLERLLALPNREWDEINTPGRFRTSSLWKEFVKIPRESVLDRMEFKLSFSEEFKAERKAIAKAAMEAKEVAAARALLALAAKARSSAPAAFPVLESSPEPPSVDPIEPTVQPTEPLVEPSEPPTKKRKIIVKGKRKVPVNRIKGPKTATPDSDDEP